MNPIRIKRIYDAPGSGDGKRILVDRIWPRGLSKEKAGIELWMKELAPSHELRKWFNHEPEKFAEFRQKYIAEIHEGALRKGALKQICEWAETEQVTLVYAAKDETHNQAVVLEEMVNSMIGKK